MRDELLRIHSNYIPTFKHFAPKSSKNIAVAEVVFVGHTNFDLDNSISAKSIEVGLSLFAGLFCFLLSAPDVHLRRFIDGL